MVKEDLVRLQEKVFSAIAQTDDLSALQTIRVAVLGKKGQLTDLLKQVSQVPAAEKPLFGQWVNEIKNAINTALETKFLVLKEAALQAKLNNEQIDVSLPGRVRSIGSRHPISQIKQRINDYFARLGFDIVDGPEIETDFYNFEALNIPAHHPARAMHDTFYFGDGSLLRTHTSSVQIRRMEQSKPPFRLIAPGRVYRVESDVSHTPMFHQVEGLLIDSSSTLAGLKGLLEDFFSQLFARTLALRFRSSYFPFTEPSAECDIACTQCSGQGCRACKFTGWIEVGGCGMVHPNVLKAVNIAPEEYQGWAFGMGIDRIAMLYYGIDDLRLMFENDVTFLSQF